MEIGILKYCSGVFVSFIYNVSNYNTVSKTPTGMFFEITKCTYFSHLYTFTVYDILVGL